MIDIKHNECILKLVQWEAVRPDWFLAEILPKYANDGHINDRTPEQRQERYLHDLSADGKAHEAALPIVAHTPWGIITARDELSVETLTRIREYQSRKVECDEDADPETRAFIIDLFQTTRKLIQDHQPDFLAIPPGPNRNTPIIALCKAIHREAMEQVLNRGALT